jgi:hypothetical protein
MPPASISRTLEDGGPHERAAQRSGRAIPVDRRTGVQDVGRSQAECVAGWQDVDQVRADAEHALDR